MTKTWVSWSFSCRCKTNQKENKSYLEQLKDLSKMKMRIRQDFTRSVPGVVILSILTRKLSYRITIKLVVNTNLGKPTKMLPKRIRIFKDLDKLENCSKKIWHYFLSERLIVYIWTEFINYTNTGQKKAVRQKWSVNHKLSTSQRHDVFLRSTARDTAQQCGREQPFHFTQQLEDLSRLLPPVQTMPLKKAISLFRR